MNLIGTKHPMASAIEELMFHIEKKHVCDGHINLAAGTHISEKKNAPHGICD
jgi:hypothetical protein